MGIFSKLFRSSDKGEFIEMIQNGALLLDVRNKNEYASGRASGSVNIPLDSLSGKIGKLKKGVPVVVVCESGARSGYAVNFLKSKGFEAYNGGGWRSFRDVAKG